jgi:hypothetical protein
MNSTLRTQTAAFGLAAFVTLSLMASIHQLALSPAPADTLARADSVPLQVVVVTGKRVSS